MPEEERATMSAQSPAQEAQWRLQTLAAISQAQRPATLQWVMRAGAGGAAITALVNVLLFFQTGAWQMLVVAAGEALAISCLVVAGGLTRRGKLEGAGRWVVFSLALAFGIAELVYAGITLYLIVGGLVMIFIVGNLVLPHRWRAWLGTASLFAAYVWLVNWFEPLPRYDVMQLVTLPMFALGIIALLVLVALWWLFRAWRRIITIRTRLLIGFVTVALVLVIIFGAGAIVGGRQSDQQQAIERLELVATFRESEINAWVQTLQTELAVVLDTEEAGAHVPTLLQGESPPQLRMEAHRDLQDYLRLLTVQRPLFEELFLMDLEGQVVLSSDAMQEGGIHRDTAYFQSGLEGPYVHPPFYSTSLHQMVVVVVRPVASSQGQVLGVLAGRASLARLSEITLERAGLGETGEAYLVNANYEPLTALHSGVEGVYVHTQGAETAIENQADGSGLYDDYQGQPVVGVYHWLPELQIALLVEQDRAEVLGSVYTTLGVVGGMALVSVFLAVVASLLLTRSIATPLGNLVETATQIAAGDLERVAKVELEDEVGALARAFNSMTIQMRGLVGSLEQHVIERTRELEQRSVYLGASAEVGRAAASILDADQLIRQVVELIRERFGLYYVGLFLVDETNEWAVLRAGTGEAGQAMLARGHRIKVGKGMIGWSVAHARARIAAEAGKDAVRLATAELPDTRAEAALPLRSRGQVLGALTVQSDQPGVFDEYTIVVLQTMADQVAIALDNARLFAESQAALEATRRAYGELSRKAWADLLRAQPDLSYCDSERGVTVAGDIWRPEMERALQEGKIIQDNGVAVEGKFPLAVPIKVRGDVIGVLDTYKPAGAGEWTSEEIALLEALADQLGVALESARLYQDAQRRAARERLTREITDKMRRATGVEGIVQTVVDELFNALGTSRAFVRLGVTPSAQDDGREGEP